MSDGLYTRCNNKQLCDVMRDTSNWQTSRADGAFTLDSDRAGGGWAGAGTGGRPLNTESIGDEPPSKERMWGTVKVTRQPLGTGPGVREG